MFGCLEKQMQMHQLNLTGLTSPCAALWWMPTCRRFIFTARRIAAGCSLVLSHVIVILLLAEFKKLSVWLGTALAWKNWPCPRQCSQVCLSGCQMRTELAFQFGWESPRSAQLKSSRCFFKQKLWLEAFHRGVVAFWAKFGVCFCRPKTYRF